MWGFLTSIFTGGLNAILGTIGKTITDVHTSTTARQRSENESGVAVHGQYTDGYKASVAARADVQKSGSWGPFGLAAFVIAMFFAWHVGAIVLDSMPFHPTLTTVLYAMPWIEWVPHDVGSWKVASLPGRFADTEHEILRALFYVGPPSAAAIIAAKAFRR